MKRPFYVIMALLILGGLAAASDAILIKVKVQLANVRTEPNLTAPVITQMKAGTLLEASAKKGDFYEIALADESGRATTGYIHANAVEVVSAAEEPPAAPAAAPAAEKPAVVSEAAPPKVEATPPPTRPLAETQETFELPRTSLCLMAGYAAPSGYGGGIAYGASLIYMFSRSFGVEISGLRFRSAVEEPAAAVRETALSKGTLAVIPVQLSLVARFRLSPKIAPYLLAGGGYYLNSYTLDSGVKTDWQNLGFEISEKVDAGVGAHFGAGLDIFLSSHLALNAVVKYGLSKMKGTWSLKDSVSSTEASGDLTDLSLKPLILALGLKYGF